MTRPSLGFSLLVIVVVAFAAFVGYGLATPPLESVWRMEVELSSGLRDALTGDERALFQRVLARHPKVAAAITEHRHEGVFSVNDRGQVDGKHAYLIREKTEARFSVVYRGADPEGSVEVMVRAAKLEQRGECRPGAPFEVVLPDGPWPRLVELSFSKGRGKRRAPVLIEGGAS